MTPGERVANVALEILAPGPMGHAIRGADYQAFLEQTWGRGAALRTVRTSCGVFAGACLIEAGIQGRRAWKSDGTWGITSWIGVGFGHRSWLPISGDLELQVGDIFYIASSAGQIKVGGKIYTWNRWQDALNGHVGVLVEGTGFHWRTAEGGGDPGGTVCRLSDGRKNVTALSRKLRGVWRPERMLAPSVAPDDETTPLDGFVELRRGSRGPRVGEWQVRLMKLGYQLPKYGADSDFGGETEGATRAFQRDRRLPNTGIVDRRTWDTARAATEPAGMPAVCPPSEPKP